MSIIIPQGQTFLSTIRKSFTDVPILEGNGIATKDFLEAAESLTTLFDLLGSVAFTPVKNDMLGNIKKLRERQLEAPNESGTLQNLVVNEIKGKSHKASEGLLWLVRGLDFTAQALRQNVGNKDEELAASFRAAYKNTLAPYHSFMVKPVFSAAMSATPYRKAFYEKMVNKPEEVDRIWQPLNDWLEALEKRVGILKEFQKTKEAKW